MIKKAVFAFVMATLLLFASCDRLIQLDGAPDSVTDYWQEITILGIGTFRLPTEWYIEQQEDGFLLITDNPLYEDDYTILIFGNLITGRRSSSSLWDALERPQIFTMLEGLELYYNHTIRSLNLSNFASFALIEYTMNGTAEEFFTIRLTNIPSDTNITLNSAIKPISAT